jgi:DnaJ-class molecular chaperone
VNYIDQKIADQLDEILDNQRVETRTCKWCKGWGKVMKTITPGLEMSVPCEDCDGKGTWEIEE